MCVLRYGRKWLWQVTSIKAGPVCIPAGFVLWKSLSCIIILNGSYICRAWEVAVCSMGQGWASSVSRQLSLGSRLLRWPQSGRGEGLVIQRQLQTNPGCGGEKDLLPCHCMSAPCQLGGDCWALRCQTGGSRLAGCWFSFSSKQRAFGGWPGWRTLDSSVDRGNWGEDNLS